MTRTRRIAYHHLILPDGTRHEMAVAEFDARGTFLSWHPLHPSETTTASPEADTSFREEAFVEWQGGTLDLSH